MKAFPQFARHTTHLWSDTCQVKHGQQVFQCSRCETVSTEPDAAKPCPQRTAEFRAAREATAKTLDDVVVKETK